ncbi:transposase [Sphingomonas sp. Leaf257]|uniref:transposase n=1 Tax=Sphingomonas sp. Leaf257 TaxID=1736309 RepID=UPI003FA7423C
MTEVCRRAGVHPTTFSRWKQSAKNPDPIGATLASLSKIEAAVRTAEKQMRKPRRSPAAKVAA